MHAGGWAAMCVVALSWGQGASDRGEQMWPKANVVSLGPTCMTCNVFVLQLLFFGWETFQKEKIYKVF